MWFGGAASDSTHEDMQSHSFRAPAPPTRTAAAATAGRRAQLTSGPTMSGSEHWAQQPPQPNSHAHAEHKEPVMSFTQQYAQLQAQSDAARARKAPAGRHQRGVWSDSATGSVGMGLGGGSGHGHSGGGGGGGGAGVRQGKHARIATAYNVTAPAAAAPAAPSISATSFKPPRRGGVHAPVLPPVVGAQPPPLGSGLPWIPAPGARPPNLMAWVKSIGRLDGDQRLGAAAGDQQSDQQQPQQPQSSNNEQLHQRYARQFALFTQQQQSLQQQLLPQYAQTVPTLEQLQFFMAQQQAAEANAALLANNQQQQQKAIDPTLAQTWSPTNDGAKGQAQPPPPHQQQPQSLHASPSQAALQQQPQQSSLTPQPPPHTSSTASLHTQQRQHHQPIQPPPPEQQQQQQQQSEPELSSSPSQSSLSPVAARSSLSTLAQTLGPDAVVLRSRPGASTGTSHRGPKRGGGGGGVSEAERAALQAEERRLHHEAQELANYQAEQLRAQQEASDHQRTIVLQDRSKGGQAQPHAERAGAVGDAVDAVDAGADADVDAYGTDNASFAFLVATPGGGGRGGQLARKVQELALESAASAAAVSLAPDPHEQPNPLRSVHADPSTAERHVLGSSLSASALQVPSVAGEGHSAGSFEKDAPAAAAAVDDGAGTDASAGADAADQTEAAALSDGSADGRDDDGPRHAPMVLFASQSMPTLPVAASDTVSVPIAVVAADAGQVSPSAKAVFLGVACRGLSRGEGAAGNKLKARLDPVAAVHVWDPFQRRYVLLGQTERLRATESPLFRRAVLLRHGGSSGHPLRVGLYDTELDEELSESALVGECFVALPALAEQARAAAEADREYESRAREARDRADQHGGVQLPPWHGVNAGLFFRLSAPRASTDADADVGAAPVASVSSAQAFPVGSAEIYVQLVHDQPAWEQVLQREAELGLESGLHRPQPPQPPLEQGQQQRGGIFQSPSADTPSQQLVPVSLPVSVGTSPSAGATVPMAVAADRGGVSEEAWQSVWRFTSSRDCVLFSESPLGPQVSARDMVALLAASGGLHGLMEHLRLFNQAGRRFQSLAEVVPAIHCSNASGGIHVEHRTWQMVNAHLASGECRLFCESSHPPVVQRGGAERLELHEVDQAVELARGVDPLMSHLRAYDSLHRRFDHWGDVLPALAESVRTGCHVGKANWLAVRSYLAGSGAALFRPRGEPSAKGGVQQRALNRSASQSVDIGTGARAGAGPGAGSGSTPATPRRKQNYLSVDLDNESLLRFSPSRLNSPSHAAAAAAAAGSNAGGASAVSPRAANSRQNSLGQGQGQALARSASGGALSLAPAQGMRPSPSAGKLPLPLLQPLAEGSLPEGDETEAVAEGEIGELDRLLIPSSGPSSPASPGVVAVHIKGCDVDRALLASSCRLGELLLHLARFEEVRRVFRDFAEMPPAIEEAKRSRCYAGQDALDTVFRWINNVDASSSGGGAPCTLFSEATTVPVEVDGPTLDQCLRACSGSLPALQSLLRELDGHRRKFLRFADVLAPVEAYSRLDQAAQQGQRRTEEEKEKQQQQAAALTRPPGAAQVDALYAHAHGHGHGHGRIPSGYPRSSPTDRAALVAHLSSGPCLSLFGQAREVRLTHSHVDAMLFEGGGIVSAKKALDQLASRRVQFPHVDALIQAVSLANARATEAAAGPLPDGVWAEVLRFLTGPGCGLFPRHKQSFLAQQAGGGDADGGAGATGGLRIQPSQLAELLTVPGELRGLLLRLKHLNEEGLTFSCFEELVEEVRRRELFFIARLHGHTALEALRGLAPSPEECRAILAALTPAARVAVLSHLSSRDSRLIQHAQEVRMTPGEVDALLCEGRGLQGTLDHLRAMDRVGRRFASASELTFALRVAHHRGYHISEAARGALLGYLASPQCRLFESATVRPVQIDGADIDALVLAAAAGPDCDAGAGVGVESEQGALDVVLTHLRQLDRVGRRFQLFSELAPAVRLARQSSTHVSPGDRDVILSYLSSPASHMFADVVCFSPSHHGHGQGEGEGEGEDAAASAGAPVHVHVDGATLDGLFESCPNRSGQEVLRALRKFDSLNRRFGSFAELSVALQLAFSSGAFADPLIRRTILEWLAAPNCRLLQPQQQQQGGAPSSSTSPAFDGASVSGVEVDELLLVVNGSLDDLLLILQRLNDSGRRVAHFADLAPLVSKERAATLATRTWGETGAADDATAAISPVRRRPIGGSGFDLRSPEDETVLTLGGRSAPPLLLAAPLSPTGAVSNSGASNDAGAAARTDAVGSEIATPAPVSASALAQVAEGQGEAAVVPAEAPAAASDAAADAEVDEAEKPRLALLDHLSSPSCQLFSDLGSADLQVDSAGIDALLASVHGLDNALGHLRVMDACGCKVAGWTELAQAVVSAQQRGCHVAPAAEAELRNFLAATPALFERALRTEETALSGLELDRFFACSSQGGWPALRARLERLQRAGRVFRSLTELLVTLERVVGGESAVAESARESLVGVLCDTDLLADAPDTELSGDDLDAMVFAAGGPLLAQHRLRALQEQGRRFNGVEELLRAMATPAVTVSVSASASANASADPAPPAVPTLIPSKDEQNLRPIAE